MKNGICRKTGKFYICPFIRVSLNNSRAYQSFIDNEEEHLLGKASYEKALSITFNGIDIPFMVPQYRMFFDPDPVLEHYKQERARIQQEYKDVDLHKLFLDAFK